MIINTQFYKNIVRAYSMFYPYEGYSCEYDRLNGWNSTLQAAWYIIHVCIIWFFRLSHILHFFRLLTSPRQLLLCPEKIKVRLDLIIIYIVAYILGHSDINRVFAIYQFCWVGKHLNIISKPSNAPIHGQPTPRKVRFKSEWHLGHFFPQQIVFRGLRFVLKDWLQET